MQATLKEVGEVEYYIDSIIYIIYWCLFVILFNPGLFSS